LKEGLGHEAVGAAERADVNELVSGVFFPLFLRREPRPDLKRQRSE
jgi:hypothetical protein